MQRKKTILVCGATGFIGRNVAEHFAGNDDLEIIGVYNRRPPFDHPGIRWVKANLTDPTQVEKIVEGIDVIIQAAATTSGIKDVFAQPHIHITDNAVMNSYIFRAAYERRVAHVVFFSCTVMLHSSVTPLREQDFNANAELHPRYFGAGWTKVYLEKMCEFFSRLGSTKFTAIRHSNIYGPHDKFDLERSHVFGATVTKVMNATDAVTVWGKGEEARDLLYIDDLVDMVARVLEKQKDPFSVYNCGSGAAITIRDLVARIIAASGKSLTIKHDLSKPTIPTSLSLDCSKAQFELGWQPRFTLDAGIRKTLEWWRQNMQSGNTNLPGSN